MAARVLLPGFGGQYTSETFSAVSSNSVGADTIDCSYVAQMAVGITTGASAAGVSIQLQTTFDGSSWQNLGSAITVNTVTLFDVTDGPFGKLRIKASVTTGTVFVSLTGWPIQRSF